MRWNYYKLRQLSLLQSAMDSYYKLRQLFYYKVRQGLLQVATGITKCDRFITNCDRYYKVRWLLQIRTVALPTFSKGLDDHPPPLPPLIWKSGSSTVVNREKNGVVNCATFMYRCVVVHWNERVSLCWNWFTLPPEMTSNGGEMYENTSARPWREERA